jgi:inorganic pyrophosphatase
MGGSSSTPQNNYVRSNTPSKSERRMSAHEETVSQKALSTGLEEVAVNNTSFSTPPPALPEAVQRNITEFDLAAYSKDEFSVSMERNIMLRFFNAFDVQQIGFLRVETMEQLCKYLGDPISADEIGNLTREGQMTFDRFFEWWGEHGKRSEHAFAMVSAAFAVPYHQQQLLVEEVGEKYTPSYRVNFFFKDVETTELKQISPWHDIPYAVRDWVRTTPESSPTNRYNFICEIPKWTRAKFEIATSETFNPIKQDMKNGVPRFYKHGDMMWNYGAFPQTWESTDHVFEEGVKGDNDPLDAIEIGMVQLTTGQVIPVKILGILGMIDDGQMDWKVICISHADPVAKFLDDISDVPKFLPGLLEALREWLRTYKICQGGVENKFAYHGEYKDAAFAHKVIQESHFMWRNLRQIRQKTNV